MSIIKINPLQLKKAAHAQLLALLLTQNSAENWFFAGEVRDVWVPRPPKTPRLVRVRLSFPLMRTGKTFAVIANKKLHSEHAASEEGIKDGGVFPVLGKVYLENELAFYRAHKTPRVLKRVLYKRDGDEKNELICDGFDREEKALKRVPHLFSHHQKVRYTDAVLENPPVTKASMLIKRVTGIPLHQFLLDYPCTISTLYLISIRILRAFHEQIHATGLVHCDVNAPNILIDPETLAVSIIDLSLARNSGEKAQLGNRDFSAPEAELAELDVPLTPATDAYSVALLLRALCWNGGKRFIDNAKDTFASDLASMQDALKRRQDPALNRDLFQDFTEEDLPEVHRPEIRRVLDGLNQFEPQQRLTFPAAAAALEIGYTHYRAAQYRDSDQKFDRARLAALEFRAAFERLSAENADPNWPVMLTKTLQNVLKTVHHGECFVKHFTDIVNIKAFHGLSTKEAIFAKALSILNQSTDNTKALLNSIQQFQAAKAWLKIHKPNEVALIKQWTCDYAKYLKHAKKLHLYPDAAGVIQDLSGMGFDQLHEFNRLGAIYSARMQEKTQQLQKLLERHKAGYVATYADIMLKLKPQKDSQDELGQLKNQLRFALIGYLKARKILTSRRYQDVKQFIDIAEKSKSRDEFLAALNAKTALIRTGFWNRSKLRTCIHKTLLDRPAQRG